MPLRIADETTEEVIEQVLYMLWDVGFKVGHSTRSIDGAIKLANPDVIPKRRFWNRGFSLGITAATPNSEEISSSVVSEVKLTAI